MDDYGASTYGDRFAAVYDEHYGDRRDDLDATVDRLASLAGDGPVLELGIGTGRVALPLRERGVEVHGIDASQAMVDRLRAKPGGADVRVTIGDFADIIVEGSFSLVYVVWNTFFGLLTQADQVRCFTNVAARLEPGGAFLIEAFVPNPGLFADAQRVTVTEVEVDHVLLGTSHHFPSEQRVASQHVRLSPQGVELYPVQIRYAWPTELDLMAQLAGLRLRSRHGGWRGEGFGDASSSHVSIWEPS